MIAAAYDAGANSYIPKSTGARLAETVGSLVRYWLNLNQLPSQPNARTAGLTESIYRKIYDLWGYGGQFTLATP